MQLRSDPLLLIDRSPLSRVVAVGQTQTGDGTTVECIALEFRHDAGRGSKARHSRASRLAVRAAQQCLSEEWWTVEVDLTDSG
jgi:hypothetical protein